MKNYLKNWDVMRLLRLALGVFIIVQGIQMHDWMFIIAGALFSLMPLFNVGCCGTTSCRTPATKEKKTEETIIRKEQL